MVLPDEYILQKFYQLAGYPKSKQGGKVYEGGCPICKEGNSWKRRRRLYYIVSDCVIYCHNCGWSGKPIKFIQEVEGLSYQDIVAEADQYDNLPRDIDISADEPKRATDRLPHDSINLCDSSQMTYYSGDEVVREIYDFAKRRKLFSAVNRPKTLWASLTDYTHKNRLIIPFYDVDGSIVFYQSRTVFSSEKLPKYLSKIGSEKTIFNLDRLDSDIDKMFIFEGPIDACFVKNGVAVAGIQEGSSHFTSNQLKQLQSYSLFDKIWVLDSQWIDTASRKKTSILIEQGETVFMWPEDYGKRFKDFNDMCTGLGVNEIPYKFILDNCYTGLRAKLNLALVSKS